MILKGLAELDRELEGLIEGQTNLGISIDGRQVSVTGWIRIGDLRVRDRLLKTSIPRDPAGTGSTPDQLKSWASGWQRILTALGIHLPDIDPHAFRLFFSNKRHLSLVTDTSALASGAVSWLARCRWDHLIEVAVPSVVERELFGWSDQEGFWDNNLEQWGIKVQYRIARRLSEVSPRNLLVRRPAIEEKAALMLAKVKLRPSEKSPDADVLLIELARDYQRVQPPEVHVFYVTGDRNHARSAVAILGKEHILYVPPRELPNRPLVGVCAFWQPSLGLGAIHRVPISEILWDFLAGTHLIQLTTPQLEIEVEQVCHGLGCPSDWTDPVFHIRVVRDDRTTPVSATSGGPAPTTSSSGEFLLAPLPDPPEVVSGPVTNPGILHVQAMLNSVLASSSVPVPERKPETRLEAFTFLNQVGLLTPTGDIGANAALLEDLRQGRWDRVHLQFKRAPGYGRAFQKLFSSAERLTSREEALVGIARRLGQAAKLKQSSPILPGDASLRRDQLVDFLVNAMPEVGRDYPIWEIVERALKDLSVSPTRFERAMLELVGTGYNRVTFETGGTVESGWSEKIWVMEAGSIQEIPVGASALYFGGQRPIRKLRRHP